MKMNTNTEASFLIAYQRDLLPEHNRTDIVIALRIVILALSVKTEVEKNAIL